MPCIPFCSLREDKPAGAPLGPEDSLAVCQASVVRGATAASVAVSAVQWWPLTVYPEGFIVLSDDGNVYQATAQNSNQDPDNLDPAYWAPVSILSNLTLNVPDDFTSITLALNFLSQANIDTGATVTIQVEDGTYNLTTNQINLNHPNSDRIQLIGNTATPASCTLGFTALSAPPTSPYLNSNSGSIFKNDGNTFGLIDGFSIVRTGGTAAWGHCGILAYGSRINLGANLIVSDFFSQIAAAENGEIIAAGTGAASVDVQTSAGASPGGYGVYANKGKITIPYLQISGTENGVRLEEGSVARLNNFTSAAGLLEVFSLFNDSILIIPNGTAGNADTYFVSVGSGVVTDTATTYGASSAGDIIVIGVLTRNGVVISSDGAAFPFSLVAIGGTTFQRILSSTESVFFTGGGLDTEGIDLEFSADGNTGISIESATGNVQAPVSIEIGATNPIKGIQGGRVNLDSSGVAVVLAPWVTANTIITVTGDEPNIIGPLYAASSNISPGVSFEVASDVGVTDSSKSVNWHAIVY